MKSLLNPGHRSALMKRLSQVRPDTPRRWGRMSAHGMICHLSDSFLGCLGDRPIWDRSNFLRRTVMRFGACTVPLPWPKGYRTSPEVDQERDGTPPGDFATDLENLNALVDTFVDRLDPETMRHPVFGLLSQAEWGRWAYRHVDHHTRQFGL